jgi:transglutaminase-like putative cysteine protease
MIVRVFHETNYRYSPPARTAIQILRLTPRDHEGQHVRFWRIDVDPTTRLRESEDCLGNLTHVFNVDGPLEKLTIVVEGEVDALDMTGVVRGTVEPFPPALFLRETSLTHASDELKDFARRSVEGSHGDRLAFLHRLMSDLHERLRFEPGATDAATSAERAFALGVGVCQDFAHVFIAAARSCGIPARYVSGYLGRGSGVSAQNAGHAWTEAHVDGLGWVGFDPANAVSSTDAYVRVAVGLDYLGAAPVLGARQGGGDETLDVRLEVETAPRQSQS